MDDFEKQYIGKEITEEYARDAKSKKNKILRPIPVLTEELLSKIKENYEYGTLPPNHWGAHRTIHSLIKHIEAAGFKKRRSPWIIEQIKKTEKMNGVDDALDLLYQYFDERFQDEYFDEIDDLMSGINLEELSVDSSHRHPDSNTTSKRASHWPSDNCRAGAWHFRIS